MPDEYTALVNDLKILEQPLNASEEEDPGTVLLPMAEGEWNTRPDTVSYGTVRMDFEADAFLGNNIKVTTAYEGSVDLYSLVRSGAGWIPLITGTLIKHCDGSWHLNHHTFERDTGLFHWEWVFQIEG